MNAVAEQKRSTRFALWAIAWLATMAAVYYGLDRARHWTLATVGTADVQTEWQNWRAEEQARAASPSGGVVRRPPKSGEPPLLILMRDYFPAIVATVLLIATVMFGFLAIVVPGAIGWRGRASGVRHRDESR